MFAKVVAIIALVAAGVALLTWLVSVATTLLHDYVSHGVPQLGMAGAFAIVFSLALFASFFSAGKAAE